MNSNKNEVTPLRVLSDDEIESVSGAGWTTSCTVSVSSSGEKKVSCTTTYTSAK